MLPALPLHSRGAGAGAMAGAMAGGMAGGPEGGMMPRPGAGMAGLGGLMGRGTWRDFVRQPTKHGGLSGSRYKYKL